MQTQGIRTVVSALFALAVFLGSRPDAQAQFPARGDDNTQSLGQFNILVFTNFQTMMVGYPGYNSSTHIFTSAVLYDVATIIGRSDPLLAGSLGDINGVLTGSAGTNVSQSMLVVQPGGLEPAGTREVHTMIYSLNMTPGGSAGPPAVRAGTNATTQPISVGEVESYSGAGGLPANDFPAQSFFDVFVDVDLPAGGTFPGATNMYNSLPLMVQNTNVTSFPPQVVYIHGMSTAVPVYFSNNNPPRWTNGQIFGLLTLAGHGVYGTNNSTGQATSTAQATTQLQTALASATPAPVEPQYSNSVGAPVTLAGTNMIFPAKADDNTTSLGTFVLAVNPAFQPYMSGYPGWNATTKRLTSPLLYDPASKIGRSSPLTIGSTGDTVGVPVGSANTIVSNGSLALIPPLFASPSNTFEVKTELRSLDLTGGGADVRAGTAASGSPGSYGEVNSLSGPSADPYWDFPAKSFFDIFVDVDIPAGGSLPAITVTNGIPLIVQQNNLTAFPPKVIYVHGNSTAVPVLLAGNYPAIGGVAGETFGIVLLAGHGIGYNQNNTNDVAQFETNIMQMTEQPVAPQYASWAPNLKTTNPPIVLTCSSNITVSATDGAGGAYAYYSSSASGGCSTPAITYNPASGSYFPIGTTTVSCTATDTCGDSADCSFAVTVNPPPVINCPSNITVTTSNINGAVVSFSVGVSGGCAPVTVYASPYTNGETFPVGTTSENIAVYDCNGYEGSCNFTVTVTNPNSAPLVFSCPSNLTVAVGNSSGATVNFTVNTSGGCGVVSVYASPYDSGGTFPLGTTTEYVYVYDCNGYEGSCSFTVTVTDTNATPLVVNCPSNLTVTASSSSGAVVNFTPGISGGCPPIYSYTTPYGSGDTFPVGTTTEYLYVYDSCSGYYSNYCSFTVTVNPPLVNEYFSPTNTLPPTNMVYISPAQWHVLFNNGIVIRDVRHRFFTHNFTPPPLGTTSNETFGSELYFNLSTDGGNTYQPASGTANVTVQVTHSQDTTSNSIYSTEMTQLDLSGPGFLLQVSPTLPSTGQTTIRPVSGGYMISSFFDIFTEVSLDGGNTWTPANGPGHVEMRPDPAQVTPAPEPTPLLPPPDDEYVSPAQWHALFAQGIVIKNVSHRLFTGSLLPPASGGSNTESFNSTLDLQVSTDGGNTFQSVRETNVPVQVTVADNGSSGNTIYDTAMNSLAVTLPGGQMLRASQTEPSRGVTEIDPLPNGTYQISSFFDIFTELSLDGGNTWSPATNGPVRMQLTSQAPEVTTSNGSLPVTNTPYISPAKWHALYANGIIITNVSHDRFTQTQPPPASGATNAETFGSRVTGLISQNGGASFTPFSVSNASVSVQINSRPDLDNGNTRFFDTAMLQLNLSGGSLPSGIMVRVDPGQASVGKTSVRTDSTGYHVSSFFDIFTDVSLDGGNTWSPTITAPATMSPSNNTPASCVVSITCPSNIVVTSSVPVAVFFNVAAGDSCDGVPMVNSYPPSGSTFPLGTTTVTSTASDANGSSSCSFTVTVNPVSYPPIVLNCSSNLTVTATSSNGIAIFFTSSASGGCGVPNVTAYPPSGSTFAVGTTTVTVTASDGCGDSTNCSFTVTVNPPVYPPIVLTCPSNITVTATGSSGATVFFNTTASGGCSPPPFVSANPPSGSTFPLGTTTVTVTAGDSCYNVTNCSFTVTVVAPPLGITCPSNITVAATSSSGAVVSFSYFASGGCAPVNVVANEASGSTFPVGTTTVTVAAYDGCGSITNCSFTVTVVKPPIVLNCSSNLTVTATSSNGIAVFFTSSASGGCGVPNVTAYPPSGSTFAVGTTTVTVTASDNCGDSTNCSFTVKVNPPSYPPIVLTCSSNITVTATGSGGATVYFNTTASGGCSPPPSVTAIPPSGSTFPVGTTTVFSTASDTCGNSTNCSFTVTVNPPVYPPIVLTCPSNITVTATGSSGATAFFNVTASGGCGSPPRSSVSIPPTVVAIPPSGSTFPIGTTTVTVTASDNCGDSTNCSFTVTVLTTNCVVSITCPPSITVTSVGPAVVFYTVTASDSCGNLLAVTTTPPSGSTFPVGATTTVTSTASNADGTNSCSFTVTVVDRPRVFPSGGKLPPTNSLYISPAQWHAAYAGGIYISNVTHRAFTANFPPPTAGTSSNETFGSKVDFMYSTDGGHTFQKYTGNATCTVKVTNAGPQGAGQFYTTMMTQLDLSGGTMPSNMKLRVNPTTPSTGQTTITPAGNGDYQISSFFDIFVDLSLDGGNTWSPSTSSGHMELHIDPSNPPTVLAQPTISGKQLAFNMPTQPGLLYTVQYSTDLTSTNWTTLTAVSGNGQNLSVTDPQAATLSHRFYRVVISEDPNQ